MGVSVGSGVSVADSSALSTTTYSYTGPVSSGVTRGTLVGVGLGVAIVSALRGGNTDGYGDDFDDGDHDASSIVDIFQSDVPTIPRADTDPDLRFYCEKAGEEKLTIQQVYQQVNPATVLVLTDLGEKA